VVQLLSADMLAWTTASVHSRLVFRRGEFNEAYGVAYVFAGTTHVRMGYMTKETLQQWEQDVLDKASQQQSN